MDQLNELLALVIQEEKSQDKTELYVLKEVMDADGILDEEQVKANLVLS